MDCNNQYGFTHCFIQNDMFNAIGPTFHVICNFVNYINGSPLYSLNKGKEMSMHNGEDFIDLWTMVKIPSLKYLILKYPVSYETYVYSFEKLECFIIVPKAEFIKNSLYVVKPFSLQLWIMLFGYIMYGSTIFSLVIYITKREFQFWRIFDHLLRSLLSQSYPNPIPGFKITLIYLLAMIMGFVITIWYSTLLGFFLTTFIQEPQVSTIAEFKKAGFKLIDRHQELELLNGYDDIKDFVLLVSFKELKETLASSNESYAYITSTAIWYTIPSFRDYFKISDFSLESGYVGFRFQENSLFKNRFHRYIHLIQDSGLYGFWKSQYPWESYQHLQYFKQLHKEARKEDINLQTLRALNINYIIYPLTFLFIGCFCGTIALLLEIFIQKFGQYIISEILKKV